MLRCDTQRSRNPPSRATCSRVFPVVFNASANYYRFLLPSLPRLERGSVDRKIAGIAEVDEKGRGPF
jgi:hypothetical protein